jgi:hypothetical protein
MHKHFLAAGFLLIMMAAHPTTAPADPYRWCAELGGGGEGSFTNCYFVTRAQCEATVVGVGGFCRQNMFYDGERVNSAEDRRSKRRARSLNER